MSEYIVELNESPTITVDGWNVRCDDWLIQREEIVRCRDCTYYREHEFVVVTDVDDACLFWADGVKVEPDGFCAWGERRSDGQS